MEIKQILLRLKRILDKLILSTSNERLKTNKLFNKFFNKEIIYNYREL